MFSSSECHTNKQHLLTPKLKCGNTSEHNTRFHSKRDNFAIYIPHLHSNISNDPRYEVSTHTLRPSSMQFIFRRFTTSPSPEYLTIKLRVLTKSYHPIFQNVFRKLKSILLGIDYEKWYWQLYLGTKFPIASLLSLWPCILYNI